MLNSHLVPRLMLAAALGLSATGAGGTQDGIEATIDRLMRGVDQQDADLLKSALAPDAGMFATTPDGTAIRAVSVDQFVELHATGKFGGQKRRVEIQSIDVTEDLVASAKVVASNETVHYTYYLGLSRTGGAWRVQTFLQRSRPR